MIWKKILKSFLFCLKLWAGLRFTLPRLKDTHDFVQFDLQIRWYDMCTSTQIWSEINCADKHLHLILCSWSAVRTKITPRVKLSPTSWRWWSGLMLFYWGEFTCRTHLFSQVPHMTVSSGCSLFSYVLLLPSLFIFTFTGSPDQTRSSSPIQTGSLPRMWL